MAKIATQPKRSKGTLIWLIVSQLMALGSLFIWAIFAGLSGMAADSGDSSGALKFILIVWAYPLFPLVMGISAWITFWHRKEVVAAILSGLAFVPPVLLYSIVWYGSLVGP